VADSSLLPRPRSRAGKRARRAAALDRDGPGVSRASTPQWHSSDRRRAMRARCVSIASVVATDEWGVRGMVRGAIKAAGIAQTIDGLVDRLFDGS